MAWHGMAWLATIYTVENNAVGLPTLIAIHG
jgi:hypothetical protein